MARRFTIADGVLPSDAQVSLKRKSQPENPQQPSVFDRLYQSVKGTPISKTPSSAANDENILTSDYQPKTKSRRMSEVHAYAPEGRMGTAGTPGPRPLVPLFNNAFKQTPSAVKPPLGPAQDSERTTQLIQELGRYQGLLEDLKTKLAEKESMVLRQEGDLQSVALDLLQEKKRAFDTENKLRELRTALERAGVDPVTLDAIQRRSAHRERALQEATNSVEDIRARSLEMKHRNVERIDRLAVLLRQMREMTGRA